MSEQAYLGLGSNLDRPDEQLRAAYVALDAHKGIQMLASSRWYPSEAVGPGQQPEYLNAVVHIRTELEPLELLDAVQQIERQQGRKRLVRWGARTLDIDILMYGNERCETERLTLPHAYLEKRNFVLYPLMDITPDLRLPSGQPITAVATQLTEEGLGAPLMPNVPFSLPENVG